MIVFNDRIYRTVALATNPEPPQLRTDWFWLQSGDGTATVSLDAPVDDEQGRHAAFEHSEDGKTWTAWTSTESNGRKIFDPITLPGFGHYTLIRAAGSGDEANNWTGNGTDPRNYIQFLLTGNRVLSGGNILYLATSNVSEIVLDNNGQKFSFWKTFKDCTQLETAPELPILKILLGFYKEMFSGCASLKEAPALPATYCDGEGCKQMFKGCVSLKEAPELPATMYSLSLYCYQEMFSGCTALENGPSELPSTTLASNCYEFMFDGCTSLTTAPALPATTLANYCYQNMFQDCISLTTAPALPAETLAMNCYSYMFNGCKSLTTAPALPATALANGCYIAMFQGCTSLATAPSELPATTLASYCYQAMFQGCTSLATAPELPATTLVYDCYYNMFNGCISLNYIKVGATSWTTSYTSGWVTSVASSGRFYKPSGTTITSGPSGIPNGWTVVNF